MVKSTKDFATLVHLEEGDYEYKFYVDGQWLNDPASEDLVETEEGIRWVKQLCGDKWMHLGLAPEVAATAGVSDSTEMINSDRLQS